MVKDAFIFNQWENRVPYYALMKWDEERILAAEKTWCACKSKGIRTAFLMTFGGGWRTVAKEAGKLFLGQFLFLFIEVLLKTKTILDFNPLVRFPDFYIVD
jgi:hypothetical protein